MLVATHNLTQDWQKIEIQKRIEFAAKQEFFRGGQNVRHPECAQHGAIEVLHR